MGAIKPRCTRWIRRHTKTGNACCRSHWVHTQTTLHPGLRPPSLHPPQPEGIPRPPLPSPPSSLALHHPHVIHPHIALTLLRRMRLHPTPHAPPHYHSSFYSSPPAAAVDCGRRPAKTAPPCHYNYLAPPWGCPTAGPQGSIKDPESAA